MRDGYLRGSLPRTPTARQIDVLVAFVAAGGSVAAAARVGIRPGTAKRHLVDLRARSGLTTEQLIYRGRAKGWPVMASLEPLSPSPQVAGLHEPQADRRVFVASRRSTIIAEMSSTSMSTTIVALGHIPFRPGLCGPDGWADRGGAGLTGASQSRSGAPGT